jgi:hypothetical protein
MRYGYKQINYPACHKIDTNWKAMIPAKKSIEYAQRTLGRVRVAF